MKYPIPSIQAAVQLVGPDELILNPAKEIIAPAAHQVLARVEAVGLCFSDLKLLKQFSAHARKGDIASGIDPAILREIPSYVPGEAPAVPGHEAVVRIWAVGKDVTRFRPGARYLVQTDYRWLPTTHSNAAFGYNFEGALQEYVLMDERIITSPAGESMLLPASETLSASAVALVEPWACVEDAYATPDRRALKNGGQLLMVAESGITPLRLSSFLHEYGQPARITWCSHAVSPPDLNVPIIRVDDLAQLPDHAYDDIIYLGCHPATVERLWGKLAPQGLCNLVLGGGRLSRPVTVPVGRVHYGGIRIIGTAGFDPAESMRHIPGNGEIRPGDCINIIGAAGPMGVMHVIRNICQGEKGVSIFAGDLDQQRLTQLDRIAGLLTRTNKVHYESYDPNRRQPEKAFDYVVLMAPVAPLVAASVKTVAAHAIINIFAGIPAAVVQELDLQRYLEKHLYFIGTSGSVLEDMKTVLRKVETGRLDSNLSVAAISGLDGAIEGLRAMEKQAIPGKIIVYPACRGLGLIPLDRLDEYLPEVAALTPGGLWNRQAEDKLLEIFSPAI